MWRLHNSVDTPVFTKANVPMGYGADLEREDTSFPISLLFFLEVNIKTMSTCHFYASAPATEVDIMWPYPQGYLVDLNGMTATRDYVKKYLQ